MVEERNSELEVQETTPLQGSGSLLAAARKRQNRSVEEIADELNLSVSQIRTIELDQSEGLPEPTYVRGYIRSYARLLGMDVDEVLQHYLNPDWRKSASLEEMPRGIGSSEEIVTGWFTFGRLFAFLVTAALLVFVWYSGVISSLFGGSESGSTGSQESTQIASSSSSVESVQPLNSPDELPQDTPEPAVLEVSDAEVPVTETPVTNSAPAVQTATTITLSFSATSWVDIRDEQDNRLAYDSFPAGETLQVSGEGLLSVFIGTAQAVTVQVNEQPYDISQYRKGMYAQFTVGNPTQNPQ